MTEDDDLDQTATAAEIAQFLDILADEATRLHMARTAASLRQAKQLCRKEGAQQAACAAWQHMMPPCAGGLVLHQAGHQSHSAGAQNIRSRLQPVQQRRRGSARAGLARR